MRCEGWSQNSIAVGRAGLCAGFFLLLLCIASAMQSKASPRTSIEDNALGMQWVYMVDTTHPGWPARLIQMKEAQIYSSTSTLSSLVISPGQHVRVQYRDRTSQITLEGIAIDAASKGKKLRVRLLEGGDLVEVWAQRAGWVTLEPSASIGAVDDPAKISTHSEVEP